MFKNFDEFLGIWNQTPNWAARFGLLDYQTSQGRFTFDGEGEKFFFQAVTDLLEEILRLERMERRQNSQYSHMDALAKLLEHIFCEMQGIVDNLSYDRLDGRVMKVGGLLLSRDVHRCARTHLKPLKKSVRYFLDRTRCGWFHQPVGFLWWLEAAIATCNFDLLENGRTVIAEADYQRVQEEEIKTGKIARTMCRQLFDDLRELWDSGVFERPSQERSTQYSVPLSYILREMAPIAGHSCNEDRGDGEYGSREEFLWHNSKKRVKALLLHLARSGRLDRFIPVMYN